MTTTQHNTVIRPLPMGRHRTWQRADALAEHPAYTQGALALSYPLPTGVAADPGSTEFAVVPNGSADSPPGAETWAGLFMQAVVEVIASDRPLAQLIRWTSRSVYAEIARRRELIARHRTVAGVRFSRQQVATVRVCQPTAATAEIAARITFGARSRAIAARLEFDNARWVCTAICFG